MKLRAGFYEATLYISTGVFITAGKNLILAPLMLAVLWTVRYIGGLIFADVDRRLDNVASDLTEERT